MPNRDEGLVFPNSLELKGRDRVKGTICPESVSAMNCGWPMHDGASRRQIFEKRTCLSLSGAFAVADCVLGIITIGDCRRSKNPGSQARFCLSQRFVRQGGRVIDGSVIDTVGAGGIPEADRSRNSPLSAFRPRGCGLCRA